MRQSQDKTHTSVETEPRPRHAKPCLETPSLHLAEVGVRIGNDKRNGLHTVNYVVFVLYLCTFN